jgi:HPt (histidine-containing phosphotransfer) domain-containing protein
VCLHRRLDENPSFYQEMIGLFESDFPAKLAHMKQALGSDDLPNLTQVAHALKGAAVNLEARRIGRTAQYIEQAAADRDYEKINNLLDELSLEFERFTTEAGRNLAEAATLDSRSHNMMLNR